MGRILNAISAPWLRTDGLGARIDGVSRRLDRRSLLIACFLITAVASGAAQIRPWRHPDVAFIGHADRADMANLARNIASGAGAVVDNVWLLRGQGFAGSSPTHPEPYWSVYVGYWLAAFFWVFGADRWVVLVSDLVVLTAIAGLAAYWAARLTGSRLVALCVSFFLLTHPSATVVVDGLSDVHLTFCVLLAGSLLIWAICRRSAGGLLASGFVTGLAIGVKPSGALLLVVATALWLLSPARRAMVRLAWLVPVGVVTGLAPLAVYDLSSFGQLSPPGWSVVADCAAESWVTGDHNRAFYDPEPYPLTPLDRRRLRWVRRWDFLVGALRGAANGRIVPIWLLASVGLAAALAWRLSRWRAHRARTSTRDPAAEAARRGPDLEPSARLFLLFTFLTCGGGILLAGTVHFEPRYWNFVVPLMAVAGFWALHRVWRLAPLVAIVAGLPATLTPPSRPKVEGVPPAYMEAARLLPENAVTLSSNPWELAYHTGRPSVALPYSDRMDAMLRVARQYGATHIVIANRDTRHPSYDRLEDGRFPPWIVPVHVAPDLVIGRIDLGASELERVGPGGAAAARAGQRRCSAGEHEGDDAGVPGRAEGGGIGSGSAVVQYATSELGTDGRSILRPAASST